MYKQYKTLTLSVRDQIATIRLIPYGKSLTEARIDLHWDIGEILGHIRDDNTIRLVVLTGDEDEFLVTPERKFHSSELGMEYVSSPPGAWLTFTGIVRTHMTMAEMEKPIIAKVNGNAIGFGASLVFSSDLIVASRDACIAHMHLSMGEIEGVGPEYGLVPGDGGVALMPLYMSPPKAKEWLMLGPLVNAAELAEQGLINYAVAPEDLDAKVDALCEKLLRRSAFALAWTKRVANRRVVQHLNMTLDAGAAYEMVSALQIERAKFKDHFSLE